MTRRYLEDLDQDQGAVEKGTYTVEVVDARSSETQSGGSMVWLDCKLIGGPDDGSVVSVSINLPRSGEKGEFYTRQKLRGFNPQIMSSGAAKLPDEEQAQAIAEAIIGARVEADLSQQSGGPFAGTQQLDATRQIVDARPPVHVQQAVEVNADVSAAAESADPPF